MSGPDHLFEDMFDILAKDPDGKRFDKGAPGALPARRPSMFATSP